MERRALTIAPEAAVSVHGISKSFGTHVVLDEVSLEIDAGSIYGLLGPNGAGKTTLIRILTTLLPASGGRAFVGGADVTTHAATVRQHIGLAGQFAAVDAHLTGRENLVMVGRLYNIGRREAEGRAEDVLRRIHLEDAADRRVGSYSGGMRRRLDLAASMVGRPKILFLDEPTTGVDPRARLDIWQLIEELVVYGTTLLLTSQYLDEAERLADRIGVIDRGKLIAEGTADELKTKVGGDRVELTVDPAALPVALPALRMFDGGLTTDERQGAITIAAKEATADLLTVVRQLDSVGVTPMTIALRRPSLDDVFMSLTSVPGSGEEDVR